jgi:hypothetical protein
VVGGQREQQRELGAVRQLVAADERQRVDVEDRQQLVVAEAEALLQQ